MNISKTNKNVFLYTSIDNFTYPRSRSVNILKGKKDEKDDLEYNLSRTIKKTCK